MLRQRCFFEGLKSVRPPPSRFGLEEQAPEESFLTLSEDFNPFLSAIPCAAADPPIMPVAEATGSPIASELDSNDTVLESESEPPSPVVVDLLTPRELQDISVFQSFG